MLRYLLFVSVREYVVLGRYKAKTTLDAPTPAKAGRGIKAGR